MFQRVAIALRSRGDEIFRAVLAGDLERMKSAHGSDLQSGDAMQGVVDWTRRAGKVKHVIHLAAVKRLVDIYLPEFKSGFVAQVVEIRLAAGQQVIDRDDGITLPEQGVA